MVASLESGGGASSGERFRRRLSREQRERKARQERQALETSPETTQRFVRRLDRSQRPQARRQVFIGAERERTGIEPGGSGGDGGNGGFGTGRSVPGTGGTVQIGDGGRTVTHTPTGETRDTSDLLGGGGGGAGGGSGGGGGGGGGFGLPDIGFGLPEFPEFDIPAGPDLDLAGPAAILGVFAVVAIGVFALASNIPSAVAGG